MDTRDRDTLAGIAEAWGVPPSTAAWALLATELARARDGRPDLGDARMALRAAVRVLLPIVEADAAALKSLEVAAELERE